MSLDPEICFRAGNLLALIGWILLVLSPPSRPWAPGVWRATSVAIPLLLALAYLALITTHWGPGGFGSIAQVRQLFERDGLLVAGWLHYLAFDLFVGTWIARQAGPLGMPHWLVVPILGLTFMLGPVGLLAFWALRTVPRWRTAA